MPGAAYDYIRPVPGILYFIVLSLSMLKLLS